MRTTTWVFVLLCLGTILCACDIRGDEDLEQSAAAAFTIRADWFDRGNVNVSKLGQAYADKYACIWNAGVLPNRAEYELDFPVTAEYTLVGLYASAGSRPTDIYLDGKKVHQGFASTGPSFSTSQARWEKQCTLHITAGKHTIKLLCPGPCMPHICALRFESPVAFPDGWKLQRQPALSAMDSARQDTEPPVAGEGYVYDYPVEPPPVYDYHQPFRRIPLPTPRAHRILEFTLLAGEAKVNAEIIQREKIGPFDSPTTNELLQTTGNGTAQTPWIAELSVELSGGRVEQETLALSPSHLEKMLQHTARLIDEFRRMPGAEPAFLEAELGRIDRLQADLDQLGQEPDTQQKWERFYRLYVDAYRLKNHVALSNPLLDFDRLLLAKRLTYNTSHIYTTYFDGSDRYKPGSGIVVLSPVRPDGQTTNLTAELKTDAIYRDPDISFDAQKVLFSLKTDRPTPCHVYEVGIDGQGLRQITDTEYDDVDPCYLPNGKIMFVSTRCRRVTLCHNTFTVSVLHTMDADGSNVRCVSNNTVHDFKPSVMPNGQIAFTRWEYVDKHLGNQQSLWVCNPDGTQMTHVAGNHFGPLTYWEPFRVPGSRYIACILAPHMPLAAGPVALVDPANSSASPAVYENLTPEIPPAVHGGWLRTDGGYYTYAYPLSEDYYLVSYCYGPDDRDPTGYGIYLLDRWNNRDLIYRDPELACFEPIPVRPRPRPPIIPPRGNPPRRNNDEQLETGTFFVANVYEGLPGVVPGEVKYLRIIEEIPKPVSANCSGFAIQYPVISNMGHLAAKRLWGTVPVESDGSAHFVVPADRPLYFAALDENFMEIQRMRSFTSVAPGERVGCIGCHEPKHSAATSTDTIAVHRPASLITPPPTVGAHGPDFYHDVQPVLNKHCAKCHAGEKTEGGIDLSADFTNLFNVAYETLTGQGLVAYASDYDVSSLPTRGPKFYGSHASKVIQTLLTEHREEGRVDLPPEDLRRLATWIDCNAPYYGTYRFSRPGTVGGRELFANHTATLNDIHKRRCQSCHGGTPGQRAYSQLWPSFIYRVQLPEIEKSRSLLAPLAKAAGGHETCGPSVFTDRSDPDFQKLREVYVKIQIDVKTNPRADMLPSRPPILDPDCIYVYRPQ